LSAAAGLTGFPLAPELPVVVALLPALPPVVVGVGLAWFARRGVR